MHRLKVEVCPADVKTNCKRSTNHFSNVLFSFGLVSHQLHFSFSPSLFLPRLLLLLLSFHSGFSLLECPGTFCLSPRCLVSLLLSPSLPPSLHAIMSLCPSVCLSDSPLLLCTQVSKIVSDPVWVTPEVPQHPQGSTLFTYVLWLTCICIFLIKTCICCHFLDPSSVSSGRSVTYPNWRSKDRKCHMQYRFPLNCDLYHWAI